ncbi:hypothetical protein C8Q77DRAFT_1117559 [Trametes polyzona]|nr:hypothetical protein C8Q77DRAFT_1142771 [Trametes polyzona]KAI0633855.1 hypothetical protein C8Q77DRAFT_1117559 [Trametes polyzona]
MPDEDHSFPTSRDLLLMNWRLRLTFPRVERPRRTRHAATPPRKLTAVELWVDALVKGLSSGLSNLEAEEPNQNVKIDVAIEEIPDTPDHFFEDTSTWRLNLRLDSVLLQRPLEVLLDEYSGTRSSHGAPTWLRHLGHLAGQSVQYTRDYAWVRNTVAHSVTQGVDPRCRTAVSPWLGVAVYIDELQTKLGQTTQPCSISGHAAQGLESLVDIVLSSPMQQLRI